MNPQPFSSLNHLTVPTATVGLLVSFGTDSHRSRREPQRQPQPTSLLENRSPTKYIYGRRIRVPAAESSTIQPNVTNSLRSRSASAQSFCSRATSRLVT